MGLVLQGVQQSIEFDDVATWIIALATVVYTVGSIALWSIALKQMKIMKAQQELLELDFKKQSKYLDSNITHSVVNSHRDIFLEIIKNKELLRVFSKNSNSTTFKSRERILATILINHAYSIWLDYLNGIKKESEFKNFAMDFSDMLSMEFISSRWQEVKEFHSKEFSLFVDSLREV